MKIQYLGTSATERIPAMFCECKVCTMAREKKGKCVRTRSQALIDDKILIDYPADSFKHFSDFDVPFKNIKTCLITHSHLDHLYTEDVLVRKRRFSYVNENPEPLVFYSGLSGYELIEKMRTDSNIPKEDFYASCLTPFESFEREGYNILPVKAVHDEKSTPLLYIIEKDGKSLFYSTDTSEYSEETLNCLGNLKKPLVLITLDCTYGNSKTEVTGHMDLGRCAKIKELLVSIGAADENTLFVLTHFSHNGDNVDYDEFKMLASDLGFITAYDGMVIEF